MVGAVVRHERGVSAAAAAASSEVLGDLCRATAAQDTDTPCREAMDTGRPRHARDLGTECRWDRYPELAVRHGIASLHSHPLRADGGLVGALSVYSAHLVAASPRLRRLMALTGLERRFATPSARAPAQDPPGNHLRPP